MGVLLGLLDWAGEAEGVMLNKEELDELKVGIVEVCQGAIGVALLRLY